MIPILYFDEVESTQDEAWKVGKILRRSVAVMAKRQIKGRGRCGRYWYSPPGGLYLSIYLPKKIPAEHGCRIQYYAATPLIEVLRLLYGVKAMLRWPNDVMVSGRKIAGILVENRVVGSYIEASVVGVGVNVNNDVEAVPEATSLKEILGRNLSLSHLLNEFLKRFLDIIENPHWRETLDYANSVLFREEHYVGCKPIKVVPVKVKENCCLDAIVDGEHKELCI